MIILFSHYTFLVGNKISYIYVLFGTRRTQKEIAHSSIVTPRNVCGCILFTIFYFHIFLFVILNVFLFYFYFYYDFFCQYSFLFHFFLLSFERKQKKIEIIFMKSPCNRNHKLSFIFIVCVLCGYKKKSICSMFRFTQNVHINVRSIQLGPC